MQLPNEILWEIAMTSLDALKNMMCVPTVARILMSNKDSILTKFLVHTDVTKDKVRKVTWKLGKRLHHPSKPAKLRYYNGKLRVSKWYRYGKLHRDNDLPAYISNRIMHWYQNNKLHRESGPAVILWASYINIVYYDWWVDHKYIAAASVSNITAFDDSTIHRMDGISPDKANGKIL